MIRNDPFFPGPVLVAIRHILPSYAERIGNRTYLPKYQPSSLKGDTPHPCNRAPGVCSWDILFGKLHTPLACWCMRDLRPPEYGLIRMSVLDEHQPTRFDRNPAMA